MNERVPYPYEVATEEQKAVGSWWWCVHHLIHLETLTEPAENRVKYILEYKLKDEQKRRLLEFRPVLNPERIPAVVSKAWAECGKARAEYDKAWAECGKAWAECEPALMALHREEYPDTTWNGKSIFKEPDHA